MSTREGSQDNDQPVRKSAPSDNVDKSIEIRISLPASVSLPAAVPRPPVRHIASSVKSLDPRRRVIVLSSVCLLAVGAAITGFQLARHNEAGLAYGSSGVNKVGSTDLVQGTPEYKTVLPKGKSIKDLGGWTRISPPDRNPVYTYNDSIGTTPINVSQQPLPDEFKSNKDEEILKLAQGFNANNKIMAGNTAIYIGLSSNGPQSVIFSKNDLLILVKSSSQIDDTKWADYVSSLR